MFNADHPAAIFSLQIKAGDELRDITGTFASRLESLTITENRGIEADQLDIVLLDHDGKVEIPQRGIELQAAIGWANDGLINKGTFIVDDVEHTGSPDKLTIRARSADLRAGLTTQKERSWHNTTLGQIAKSIAATHQLELLIPQALAGQTLEHIDQTNESDANLLTRLASMFDAIFTVKMGKLLIMRVGLGVSASGKPLERVTITRASGDQHRFSVADRDTYTAVKALYHDVRAAIRGHVLVDDITTPAAGEAVTTITEQGRVYTLGKTYTSKGGATRAARNKYRALQKGKQKYGTVKAYYLDGSAGAKKETIITAENVNGSKGPDALASAQSEPADALTASADNIKTLRHIYANRLNATRGARAELQRLKRGTSTFDLTLALGRPDISPEIPATVSGWKPSIDSTDWIVARVVHALTDAAGLISRVELELKISEPGE